MSLTDRDRKIVAVLAVLVVLAGFWFLLLSPKREQARDAADQLEQQEERRDAAVARLEQLQTARDSFARDYATVVRLGKAIPTRVDVPSLIVQLEDAAETADVEFDSIAVGERTAASVGAVPPTDAASTATVDAAAEQDGAPPATDPTAAGATPSPGTVLEQVPLDFSFEGDFFDLADFFHDLKRYVKVRGDRIEVDGRLLTIDRLVLTPSEKGGELVAEIGATAYLSPAVEGATAGATAAGPPLAQPAGGPPTETAPADDAAVPPAAVGGATTGAAR